MSNILGAYHFIYFDEESTYSSKIMEGYFYIDKSNYNFEFKVEMPIQIQKIADTRKQNLFKVYGIRNGNVEFANNFITHDSGYVRKENTDFAFVNNCFISPILVNEYNLKDEDYISYIKKIKFNRKKQAWGWAVDKIENIKKDD